MPRKVPYDAAAALTFDTMIRNEPSWLLSGASLLRAAHAVLRQVEIDSKARKLADESQNLIGRRRARLQLPAVFLAALGAENAFKAAIVARGLIRNHDKGLLTELPNLLGSHDLAQLAQQAHVKPADDAQRQAIANGQIIIMAIGRYHVTKRLDDYPSGSVTDPFCLIPAYRDLYLTAAEVVQSLHCRRDGCDRDQRKAHVADFRTRTGELIGGVYHAPNSEAHRDLLRV